MLMRNIRKQKISNNFAFVGEYFTNYQFSGKRREDKANSRELQRPVAAGEGCEDKYSLQHDFVNGFRIMSDCWGLTGREIDGLVARSEMVIMDLFRLSVPGFRLVAKKMQQHGARFRGCAFGERDTGCDWKAHPGYFRGRREAAAWYKKWLIEEPMNNLPPVKGGGPLNRLQSDLLPGGNLAEYIRRGLPDKSLHFIAHAASTMLLHHYLEWGFDSIWLERGNGLSNYQMGIAFARGAARQYRRDWGLDISAWEAVCGLRMPAHYTASGKSVNGPSADLMFRCWILGYLAGADFVMQEMTDAAFWRQPKRRRRISPAGRMAQKFMRFVKTDCPDRGRPYVPAALMLEHDHGWDAPRWKHRYQVWGNKVPYEHGDFMIENFFKWAFPGCMEVGREFMKTFNPDLPWQSNRDYQRKILRGFDVRPFEKALAPSRWGDSFDVVLENCPLRALEQYQAVFVLGRLKLNRTLCRKLFQYVENGGTLAVNVRQIPDELANEFGYKIISRVRWTQQDSVCKICGAAMPEGNYEYTAVAPAGAEVAACNRDERDPLALRRRLGRGVVWITTPHYNHEIGCYNFTNICGHALDHVMQPLMPVEIVGPPVEYMVNARGGDWLVTLSNNSRKAWRGTIRVPDRAGRHYGAVEDLLARRPVAAARKGGALHFNARIPPFKLKIFRVEGGEN